MDPKTVATVEIDLQDRTQQLLELAVTFQNDRKVEKMNMYYFFSCCKYKYNYNRPSLGVILIYLQNIKERHLIELRSTG